MIFNSPLFHRNNQTKCIYVIRVLLCMYITFYTIQEVWSVQRRFHKGKTENSVLVYWRK